MCCSGSGREGSRRLHFKRVVLNSKIKPWFCFVADLIEKYGRLPFNLDFYTDVLDLDYLLDHLQVCVHIAGILAKRPQAVSLVTSTLTVYLTPLHNLSTLR